MHASTGRGGSAMLVIVAALPLLILMPSRSVAGAPPASATAACAQMNLTTKIGLMHGWGWRSKDPRFNGYSRNSGCGGFCGPAGFFRWDNGPQGFADHAGAGLSTQWPSTLNAAATFDPDLAERWGTAMGEEFWHKGTNIQEGPGAGIARIEKNGRTFEYVSGEDPHLGATMAVPIVKGIQQNVMAIGKHYIVNNQETDRSGVNEIVDEKTLMELYFPAFEAMAPHVAGYMCAYNRINGHWACENNETLTVMLKGRANFSGFVVSDWGATHSTSPAINAGLDIDMPDPAYFSEELVEAAIKAGNVTEEHIHESCVRIMSGWYSLPEEKRFPCNGQVCLHHNVSTPANKALARELAAKSTVLLKNEGGLLPLQVGKGSGSKPLRIALIGVDASDSAYTAGQGSGGVQNSPQMVSAVAAFSAIPGVNVTYDPASSMSSATAAAAAADVAIVFGSAHAGEGHDRPNLLFNLPAHSSTSFAAPTTEAVISAVAKVQKQTIVVAIAPGQILTDWRHSVPAILCPFLPGEQFGNGIADIIFGRVVPQAKLPLTFPNVENEQGMTQQQWPGVPSKQFPGSLRAEYSEGQINGYRWYDKHGVVPAFPFGHGLTYGISTYSNLQISARSVSFDISVSGNGCDTPQVYLGYPGAENSATVPTKVLRRFQKTCSPGKTTITAQLSDRDVSSWNVATKQWQVVSGEFKVYVGSSSQDIRLSGVLQV